MECVLKPPGPLSLQGNIADNWKQFKQSFENFMIAAELADKEDRVKVAILLNCLGSESLALYNSFSYGNEEDKHKLKIVLEKFEERCQPLKNITYDRHVFFTRKQAEVLEEAHKVLDGLRDIRSVVEGTAVDFEGVRVREDTLSQLRKVMLMHVPGSLTSEVKVMMRDLVIQAFEGSCKKVLFGALVTCPWYLATQDDRGLQAKHNNIFVVYVGKDEQFFAPVNPQDKEKESEVIDQDWFYAAEIYHFANHLSMGKVRFVEALCLPQAAVFHQDEDWNRLVNAFEGKTQLQNLRGFVEQCRGQAVGSVARKKKKSGKMALRDTATLYNFCESFRLLHHVSQTLDGQELVTGPLHLEVMAQHPAADQALQALINGYKEDESVTKLELLDILMKWKGDLDGQISKGSKFTPPNEVTAKVGAWMSAVRCGGQEGIPKTSEVNPSQQDNLLSLMRTIGGQVAKMELGDILLVARAGSSMYGLTTPHSDVDYVIIYTHPIQKLLSSCSRPSESFESRGPEKSFEYGAYEARLLCEMLWKGSVVILELVFSDDLEYMSDAWKVLNQHKSLFVTERSILQYFGLIKNNMASIRNPRAKQSQSKLFYQIFHKLHCLEYFLRGEPPKVKCEGQVKDFIMSIRKGPLEGDLSIENLYEKAEARVKDLKEALSQRTTRLPENVNFRFLRQWIMTVRGWGVS